MADELLAGKGDVSVLQMGRRVIASASGVAQELALKDAKDRKQADEDAHFRQILALIKDGQLSAHIADEIFDNKTDLEIRDIISEIEAATGDSFENYARGILDDDVPERLENENDADYQRRVLKAVTKEIIDPTTGKIKPEYADDPVAKIIQREDVYYQILDDAKSVKARAEREGVTIDLTNEVDDKTSNNFNSGDIFASELDSIELIQTAKYNQDKIRDDATNSIVLASESDDFFEAVPLDDSKIAQVSEAGKVEFNEKSQGELTQDNSIKPSLDVDIKPS